MVGIRYIVVYERFLPQERPSFSKPDVSLQWIDEENVHRIGKFRSDDHVDTFRQFIEEGRYGVLAEVDSDPVGHAWAFVCQSSVCNEMHINLRNSWALIHYCFVKKTARGNNIYPMMLIKLYNELLSNSVDRVLIDTDVNNDPSQRGIEKAGFDYVGKQVYLEIGSHRTLTLAAFQ